VTLPVVYLQPLLIPLASIREPQNLALQELSHQDLSYLTSYERYQNVSTAAATTATKPPPRFLGPHVVARVHFSDTRFLVVDFPLIANILPNSDNRTRLLAWVRRNPDQLGAARFGVV
jgi:hypothetical protein